MRYVLDTEFDERAGEQFSLQVISVAIVAEDGREFYAENCAYDWQSPGVDPWLTENVKPHLRGGEHAVTLAQMRAQLIDFFAGDTSVQMWAYYAATDWVSLYSVFGRMVDLPEFMPRHCLDLKQAMLQAGVPKSALPAQTSAEHDALADAHWNLLVLNQFLAQGVIAS